MNAVSVLTVPKSGFMKAWQCANNAKLALNSIKIPIIKNPNDLLVKIKSASVNPIDVMMRDGYGQNIIGLMRGMDRGCDNTANDAVTLGRDFSGIIVDKGINAQFTKGQEVWGALGVQHQGTHAEYVTVQDKMISSKPKSLSDAESASIPYAGLTSWAALINFGGVEPSRAHKLKALVLGGSGGVGTFSIQLLKAWGAYVVTTCRSDAIDAVTKLGPDCVLDYTDPNYTEHIKNIGPYNIILELSARNDYNFYLNLLRPGSKIITTSPPMIKNFDQNGLIMGLVSNSIQAAKDTITAFGHNRNSIRWAFYMPNGEALKEIARLVDQGKIRPVIESEFEFDQLNEAYDRVQSGHMRGKCIVNNF